MGKGPYDTYLGRRHCDKHRTEKWVETGEKRLPRKDEYFVADGNSLSPGKGIILATGDWTDDLPQYHRVIVRHVNDVLADPGRPKTPAFTPVLPEVD